MRPTARPIVLKTGGTIACNRNLGDFEGWIEAGLGLEIVVLDATREGASLADAPCAIVVTGSPASVTERAPWMRRAGDWLAAHVRRGVPVLGICFGHQLLAEALGGRVTRNPRGREVGTKRLELLAAAENDPLFGHLAQKGTFLAQTSHGDTVELPPPGAIVLARSRLDACQAFRASADLPAWGVQFHPEFDAEITRGYVRERAEALRSVGIDPAELLSQTVETPEAATILARFAALLATQ